MHLDNFSYHNERIRAAHVPIWPCEPHPDFGYLLYLKGGMELRKRSWVKIDQIYEVNWGDLGAYDNGQEYVLEEESWEVLGDAMRMWWEGEEE